MDEAAVALNLRPHLCGPSKFKLVRLASAADIEGHRFVLFCFVLYCSFVSIKTILSVFFFFASFSFSCFFFTLFYFF